MSPSPDASGAAVLRLDVVATTHAIARVTSILTTRRFGVRTLHVAPPEDGFRRITVELDADDAELRRAVKYLYRSPEVVRVVHLAAEESHSRQAAFVVVEVPSTRLPEVVTIAQEASAEIVEAGRGQCTLFAAADPRRIDALVDALGDFTTREVVLSPPLRTRAHRGGTRR